MVQTKSHSVYDEVFELCPKALQDVCLSTVAANLSSLTSFEVVKADESTYKKNVHFNQHVTISNRVAEKMLQSFSEESILRNDTLSIFKDHASYNLKSLRLPDINMKLCGQELMEYSRFELRELELGCTNRLNRWSIEKLKKSFIGSSHSLSYLKIDVYPAVIITSGTIFDFFVQFPNLRSIFYDSPIQNNAITFTNENWNLLLSSCNKLKVLHININGSPKDIELDSKLFCQAENLRSLSLYSALKSEVAVQCFGCIQYFTFIENLRELDLSVDIDPQEVYNVQAQEESSETHSDLLANHVNSFLAASANNLPLVESLDLSGIYKLDDKKIQCFLDSHSTLKFLGLCMLQSKFCVNADVADYYSNVTISGCVLEKQIVTSLLKYANRVTYMKEVLKGLFQVSSGWDKRRPYILKIVLDVMERFKGHMQLQMAATACVFHLAKEPDGVKPDLHTVLLSEIARVTSMVLVLYPKNLQMVKNCLLIICTDRILHHANFDRVAMSRLCLNCMIDYQENVDRHVTRMAVAIVSILACKISSKDTSNLMKEREMKLLLDIVEKRLTQKIVDGTLKFDLSALWNLTGSLLQSVANILKNTRQFVLLEEVLTSKAFAMKLGVNIGHDVHQDESPQACKLFVDLDGLNKYQRLLETFEGDMHIETKVLGLLNNIAEVEFLHDVMLLDENLMIRVRHLISNQQVQVSYFACGIIANLALRWDQVHTVLVELEKAKILTELESAIKRWGRLDSEIVTYRSFKPFFGLLQCMEKPEIQRWAIWAIHHVCSLSAGHYKDLMSEECLRFIERIRQESVSHDVRKLCDQIYEAVQKWPSSLSI